MESIGIGALAKRAGVGIDTVRYYERSGLLAPQARLSSICVSGNALRLRRVG